MVNVEWGTAFLLEKDLKIHVKKEVSNVVTRGTSSFPMNHFGNALLGFL
jgi:hypothetical protein